MWKLTYFGGAYLYDYQSSDSQKKWLKPENVPVHHSLGEGGRSDPKGCLFANRDRQIPGIDPINHQQNNQQIEPVESRT